MKKLCNVSKGLLLLSLLSVLQFQCKKDTSPIEPPRVEKSFSIVGRVVDAASSEAAGVPRAAIFLNDLHVAFTNEQGMFEIDSTALSAADAAEIDFTFPLTKPGQEMVIEENTVYQVDENLLVVPDGAIEQATSIRLSPIPGSKTANAETASFLELDLQPEGLAFHTPLIFRMPDVEFLSGFTDTVFVFSEKYNVTTSQWLDEGKKGFGLHDTLSIFLDRFSRHRYRTKPAILVAWAWDGDAILQGTYTFEVVDEMCAGSKGVKKKVEKSLSKEVSCSNEFLTPFVQQGLSPLNVKLSWNVEIPACKCCGLLFRYQVKKYKRKLTWAAYRSGDAKPQPPYPRSTDVYYRDGFKALEVQLFNCRKNTGDPACHDQGGGGS